MKFEFLKNNPQGPYEGVSPTDWQDWKWQLRHSLKKLQDFEKIYDLSADERMGFQQASGLFQIRSTPYYAVLGSRENALDPIRLIQTPHAREAGEGNIPLPGIQEMLDRQEMPGIQEMLGRQEMLDPLGEAKNSVATRLVHRYADRVLFLVTDFCSVYCRFCTRKRFTGHNQALLSDNEYAESLDYIRRNKGLREVILSGGDPLTLNDDVLEEVLKDLRKIEHIEIIRVGSRMPVVNPFRMTDSLLRILQKAKPVYLMTHFNHPKELTYQAAAALEKTADAGVPMMNQMVLLNGINNHPAVVQALSRRLLYLRVKPYYMFQCDPSLGTDHLRTSISDSLDIQRELWGHLSGLAMPNFSIDIPNGGGKAAMVPNFLVERLRTGRLKAEVAENEGFENERGENKGFENEGAKNEGFENEYSADIWRFKGFDGVEYDYIDPRPENIRKPVDIDAYVREWEETKKF